MDCFSRRSRKQNPNSCHACTDGGEARAVTKEDEPISAFEWHPSGNSFIFLKPEKEDKVRKEVEKRYGAFETDDKEFTQSHLWQIDFVRDQLDPSELPCYESVDSLRIKTGCIMCPKQKAHRWKIYGQRICYLTGWHQSSVQPSARSAHQ